MIGVWSIPGVDDLDSRVEEVSDVACCEHGVVNGADRRDLRVGNADRAATTLAAATIRPYASAETVSKASTRPPRSSATNWSIASPNGEVRFGLGEFRDDVCVENDHAARSGACS
jgi:hypothetical protein